MDNLLKRLWLESSCEEREEFVDFLDRMYSLDTLKKAIECRREKENNDG